MVLQLQGADATALALLHLLVAEPGVLIVQLVAQPIQQRVDAVMDQVALGEGERWGLHQLVANRPGQLRQGWIGTEQLLQPLRPCTDRRVQPSGELGQPFQAIGDGHQIAGTGMARSCPASESLQVAHRPQQLADRQPQAAFTHQVAHQILALLNGLAVYQRCFQPAAQATAAHGGEGAIDGPEQRPLQLVVALGGGELEVAAGLGIQHQGIAAVHDRRHLKGNAAVLLQGLGVLQITQQAAEGLQGQGVLR